MDALHSYQPRERKLEILKDSHIGAFSVIKLAEFGLIYVAAGKLGWQNGAPRRCGCCRLYTSIPSAIRELKEELNVTVQESDLIYCGQVHKDVDSEFHRQPFHYSSQLRQSC